MLPRQASALPLAIVLSFLPLPSSLAPAAAPLRPLRVPAVFALGDSYADTGNRDRHDPRFHSSWRDPYGATWPGRPAGRFSDGRVLTDFVASFLDLPSPLPYQERAFHPELISKGMNFAFGGSGVFQTFGTGYPTIEEQIDQLDEILQSSSSLTEKDYLAGAVVLLVYGGNDYSAYVLKHHSIKGILSFIEEVVNQIDSAIRRIHNLGFRRFLVTNLEPAGCLPISTAEKDFVSCNAEYNVLALYHNKLLDAKVLDLQRLPGFEILILNQYRMFLLSLKAFREQKNNELQPCCSGIRNFSCGELDRDGKPLYTLCSSPEKAFFWDSVHPTQAGWESVAGFYKTEIISRFRSHGKPVSRNGELSHYPCIFPNQTTSSVS